MLSVRRFADESGLPALALVCVLLARALSDAPAAFFAVSAASALVVQLVVSRTRSRRRLLRSDGLRKTLNEAILHDLKNPMTSIMGCLSMLGGGPPDDARRRTLVEIALHACRAQMALIDTLSDTARLEGDQLGLSRRPVDLDGLLEEAVSGLRGTAESLGVRLEYRHGPALAPPVSLDSGLFLRVILNLLQNALKYSVRGSVVTLFAESVQGDLSITVRDTGVGIGREHLGKMFKKYYRVEGGDQTSRRGSGLGLYFCRLVVEAHGGTIDAASEPGRGTTVSIVVPKQRGEP